MVVVVVAALEVVVVEGKVVEGKVVDSCVVEVEVVEVEVVDVELVVVGLPRPLPFPPFGLSGDRPAADAWASASTTSAVRFSDSGTDELRCSNGSDAASASNRDPAADAELQAARKRATPTAPTTLVFLRSRHTIRQTYRSHTAGIVSFTHPLPRQEMPVDEMSRPNASADTS